MEAEGGVTERQERRPCDYKSEDGVVRPQVVELPEHQKLEEAKRRLGGGEAQGGDTHTRTCF